MLRSAYLWSAAVLGLVLVLAFAAHAQQDTAKPMPPDAPKPAKNPPPPRSDTSTPDSQPQPADETAPGKSQRNTDSRNPSDSSSRSTLVDLAPPIGDVQEHPDSEIPEEVAGPNELRPWNPHRAEKNIEVGDYYFKQKNYRGAESRYREALEYKPNDAVATFRLAQVTEKNGRLSEAQHYYQEYLKILPHGPYASDCHKALERLQAQSQGQPRQQSKNAR